MIHKIQWAKFKCSCVTPHPRVKKIKEIIKEIDFVFRRANFNPNINDIYSPKSIWQ